MLKGLKAMKKTILTVLAGLALAVGPAAAKVESALPSRSIQPLIALSGDDSATSPIPDEKDATPQPVPPSPTQDCASPRDDADSKDEGERIACRPATVPYPRARARTIAPFRQPSTQRLAP
jgi:hypothetical protein